MFSLDGEGLKVTPKKHETLKVGKLSRKIYLIHRLNPLEVFFSFGKIRKSKTRGKMKIICLIIRGRRREFK